MVFHPAETAASGTLTFFQVPTSGAKAPRSDEETLLRGRTCAPNVKPLNLLSKFIMISFMGN
jgi:hypothetical protein